MVRGVRCRAGVLGTEDNVEPRLLDSLLNRFALCPMRQLDVTLCVLPAPEDPLGHHELTSVCHDPPLLMHTRIEIFVVCTGDEVCCLL